MIVFIGGSISVKYLEYEVQDELDKIMQGELEILVGDAYGVDSLIQKYCYENGYDNVKVYASNGKARNNIGSWKIEAVYVPSCITGREFYTQKDIEMSAVCDYGFMIWDGKSKGTLANIERLVMCRKGCKVYLSAKRRITDINDLKDLKQLNQDISTIYNKQNKQCCSCGKLVKFARDILCDNAPSFICEDCDKRDAEDTVCQIWTIPNRLR